MTEPLLVLDLDDESDQLDEPAHLHEPDRRRDHHGRLRTPGRIGVKHEHPHPRIEAVERPTTLGEVGALRERLPLGREQVGPLGPESVGLIEEPVLGFGREPQDPEQDVINAGGQIVVPLDVRNIALAFLMAVLASAATAGFWPALFASLTGALAFNFFFLDPLYTFTIRDPESTIAFFFSVAWVVWASAGVVLRQRWSACGQRGEKGQPGDTSSGRGACPGMVTRASWPVAGSGTQAISPAV